MDRKNYVDTQSITQSMLEDLAKLRELLEKKSKEVYIKEEQPWNMGLNIPKFKSSRLIIEEYIVEDRIEKAQDNKNDNWLFENKQDEMEDKKPEEDNINEELEKGELEYEETRGRNTPEVIPEDKTHKPMVDDQEGDTLDKELEAQGKVYEEEQEEEEDATKASIGSKQHEFPYQLNQIPVGNSHWQVPHSAARGVVSVDLKSSVEISFEIYARFGSLPTLHNSDYYTNVSHAAKGSWGVLSFHVLQFMDFWLSSTFVVATFTYMVAVDEKTKVAIYTGVATALIAISGPTKTLNIILVALKRENREIKVPVRIQKCKRTSTLVRPHKRKGYDDYGLCIATRNGLVNHRFDQKRNNCNGSN
eukprot:Gb_24644 [translate_table: standard]